MSNPIEQLAAAIKTAFGEPMNVYRVNISGAKHGMTCGPRSLHADDFAERLAVLLAEQGVSVARVSEAPGEPPNSLDEGLRFTPDLPRFEAGPVPAGDGLPAGGEGGPDYKAMLEELAQAAQDYLLSGQFVGVTEDEKRRLHHRLGSLAGPHLIAKCALPQQETEGTDQ